MASYKVIVRKSQKADDDLPSWQQGCPILVDAIQVSRNTETGKAFVQSRIRNISDKTIGALHLKVVVRLGNGETTEYEHRDLDADITAGMTYDLKPIELTDGDVLDADITVVSADEWVEDDQKTLAVVREPIDINEQYLPERALVLREAGCTCPESALQYRLTDYGNWWLCPCGCINVERKTCWNCSGDKVALQASEDQETLAAHERERKEAEAANEQAEKAAAEAAKAKKRKTTIIVGCVTAIALVAFFVATTVVIPSNKYNQATALEETGDFDGAIQLYSQLGDYKDSKVRVDACREANVAALIDAGSYATAMTQAAKIETENAKDLYAQAEIAAIKKNLVGREVTFGHNSDGSERKWVILDKQDDKALLRCRYVYGTYKMSPAGKGDNWADSWLREQLNNEEGLDEIASKAEQKYIVEAEHIYDGDLVTTNGESVYAVGSEKSCKDKVFILNVVDALNYMPTTESRRLYVVGKDNETIGTYWLSDFDYLESEKRILGRCVDCDDGVIRFLDSTLSAYVCPVIWVSFS